MNMNKAGGAFVMGDNISAKLAADARMADSLIGQGVYEAVCVDVLPEVRSNILDLGKYRDMRALRDTLRDDGRHQEYLRTLEDMAQFEQEAWKQTAYNKTPTVGLNDITDKWLAGSSYTAAWYMGLKGTGTPAAGDTSSSHGTWTEDQNYTQSTRPAPAFSSASGGVKSTSSAVVFTMNATTTIYGCFLITVATKGGTTGVLGSAGDFTGGSQAVTNTSTLNVSYSYTAASAN